MAAVKAAHLIVQNAVEFDLQEPVRAYRDFLREDKGHEIGDTVEIDLASLLGLGAGTGGEGGEGGLFDLWRGRVDGGVEGGEGGGGEREGEGGGAGEKGKRGRGEEGKGEGRG